MIALTNLNHEEATPKPNPTTVARTAGMSNRVTGTGLRLWVPFWDFDTDDSKRVKEALRETQERYHLGTAYVFTSRGNGGGYHALTLDALPRGMVHQVIHTTPGTDEAHLEQLHGPRKRLILRIDGKGAIPGPRHAFTLDKGTDRVGSKTHGAYLGKAGVVRSPGEASRQGWVGNPQLRVEYYGTRKLGGINPNGGGVHG